MVFAQCHSTTEPQAIDLRLRNQVGLTLHNANTLTAVGPPIRMQPVGTRAASGVR